MTKAARTALKLIKENKYLTLATASKTAMPWSTPVYYVFDRGRFYWYSRKLAVHSQNLVQNRGMAAGVIFDSCASSSEASAVYFSGKAKDLSGTGLRRALVVYANAYYGKHSLGAKQLASEWKDFLESSPLRFYELRVRRFSILGEEKMFRGKYLDEREEVKFSKNLIRASP